MSSLEVLRANGGGPARDIIDIPLHADDDSTQETVVLCCATLHQLHSRFFELHLHFGHSFNLYTANGVEVAISIGDSAHMQAPVAYTQRAFIERSPTGNIGGNHTVYVCGFMRTWDLRGEYSDFPFRWPIPDRKYNFTSAPRVSPSEHVSDANTSSN